NALFVWLLWNGRTAEMRDKGESRSISRATPPARALSTVVFPPKTPTEPNLQKNFFGPGRVPNCGVSAALVTNLHLDHFEQTRARHKRTTGPRPMTPVAPAFDSDLLRPAHFVAPYPAYRESQMPRGLFPGSPRRLP